MNEREEQKRRAAQRAVEFVEDGMILGLGTGSTARHMIELLGERLREGTLRDLAGVPTSRVTEQQARDAGVPVVTLEREPRLDLTIDGADEVDPNLDLVKGMGGALLWEKIVASASDRLVIIADESKQVERLGQNSPLPVEVIPFGWTTHLAYLDLLGAQATLRRDEDDNPVLTDAGHYLLDCRFEDGILEPERLERELRRRVGIVETGLFLRMADAVVIAGEDEVRVLTAEES